MKFGDYTEDPTPATDDETLWKDISVPETKRSKWLDIAKRFVAFLPSFTAASTLDGSEVVAVSQGGNPRRTTVQAIADLGGGGGGSPGGSDTQVQFNDGGSFGGDAGMIFNKTTNVLAVGGYVQGGTSSGIMFATEGATPVLTRNGSTIQAGNDGYWTKFSLFAGGAAAGEFDNNSTAGSTRFLLYDVDSGTLKRVSVGAADSGGAGFRVLRVPN